MTTDTTAARATDGDDDAAGARYLGDADSAPFCGACGTWVGMFEPGDGWQHVRGNPAPNGTRAPYDPGHDVELAWCVPPARSVSPAQHEHLLAALDDAIAYREHAAASGYATAYRMLRRQLAGPVGQDPPADRNLD
jgi:hypothetical protein